MMRLFFTDMKVKNCGKSLFFVCTVFTVVLVFGYFPLTQENRVKNLAISSASLPVSFLTIHTNEGRLGNQMFTFATLYGLGRINNRSIALMPKNYNFLCQYFDMHKYPVVDEKKFVEQNPWEIVNWLREWDHSIPKDTNIIKGELFPTSFTFFNEVREEITEIFRFSNTIRNQAQEFLRHVKKIRPWTEVFVGIHVRRGDYLGHNSGSWLKAYDGREVDLEYFQKAVDYFRGRFNNVTFLAVSDERDWCRTHLSELGILTTPDSPGPAQDLALLIECNHTIMTYGTYGFWGGYLAGGEVVYFTDFLRPNTSFAQSYFRYEVMYPPEWVSISTTKPGYWENYMNPF